MWGERGEVGQQQLFDLTGSLIGLMSVARQVPLTKHMRILRVVGEGPKKKS